MELSNKHNNPLKRKSTSDMSSLVYGKIAPQAPEFEAAILGAIMLEPDSLSTVIRFIESPDYFYSDANQRIFGAIKEMHSKGTRIDFMTVCEQLRKTSELEMVGGHYYVTKLTQDVVSSANIIEHTLIVVEKYLLREIIRLSGAAISDSYDDGISPFEILDNLKEKVEVIKSSISRFKYKSFQYQLDKTLDKIVSGTIRTDVTTGYEDWDKANGGGMFAGLYFIGGRPSMGKSSFMIETYLRQAKLGIKVGVWSGEMEGFQLITRTLSNLSEVPAWRITDYKNLKIEETTKLQLAAEELGQLPLELDDTPRDIESLLDLFRYWVNFCGVKAIWLDYIRLIKVLKGSFFRTDTDKINLFNEKLRELAKELGIPIFVLIQLNRQIETRSSDSRKPKLSDLKNSGEVEESAFQVAFIDRPEKDNPDPMLQKDMIFSIRKNREGSLIDISFIAELSRYSIKERPRTVFSTNTDMSFDDEPAPSNKLIHNKTPQHLQNNETKQDNKDPHPF